MHWALVPIFGCRLKIGLFYLLYIKLLTKCKNGRREEMLKRGGNFICNRRRGIIRIAVIQRLNRMSKAIRQLIRALAVAAALVLAMLATQAEVRSNPTVFFADNMGRVAFGYVIAFLLCWGVDAGFEAYFNEYKMRTVQKVKLGVILLVAVSFTSIAFYHDWKYDGPAVQKKAPFIIDFIRSWPLVAIYVAVISTIEIVAYLFLKLIWGEAVRLYKAVCKSSIHP